jgi:putative membrane protein insertion efficiency factor
MINKLLDLLMLPFILIIKTWQKFIAPGLAPRCKYYPSCSQYTYESIKNFHIFGIALGVRRVIRCNPLSHGGVDYPPKTLKIGPFLLSNRETESMVR